MSKKASNKCRCGNPGTPQCSVDCACVPVDGSKEAKEKFKELKFGDKIYVPNGKPAPCLVYFCGVKDSSVV